MVAQVVGHFSRSRQGSGLRHRVVIVEEKEYKSEAKRRRGICAHCTAGICAKSLKSACILSPELRSLGTCFFGELLAVGCCCPPAVYAVYTSPSSPWCRGSPADRLRSEARTSHHLACRRRVLCLVWQQIFDLSLVPAAPRDIKPRDKLFFHRCPCLAVRCLLLPCFTSDCRDLPLNVQVRVETSPMPVASP